MTDVQMLVLLPRFSSGPVLLVVGCVTVTQFLRTPPCGGSLKENSTVWVAPGAMEALAVQLIGSSGPAPGVQETGSEPPAPV